MASMSYDKATEVIEAAAEQVLKDFERLLFEVWHHALAEAQRDGVMSEGIPDWRFYMAVDLLERWRPEFEEFERRFRAGPPS